MRFGLGTIAAMALLVSTVLFLIQDSPEESKGNFD